VTPIRRGQDVDGKLALPRPAPQERGLSEGGRASRPACARSEPAIYLLRSPKISPRDAGDQQGVGFATVTYCSRFPAATFSIRALMRGRLSSSGAVDDGESALGQRAAVAGGKRIAARAVRPRSIVHSCVPVPI
jgi:hypothetical protein